jgi:hypothetical protein
MKTTAPNTAAGLLALVRPFGPTVEDKELVFALDPPDELMPLLNVLHTGIRALLTARKWWANVENGKTGRFTRVELIVLDPDQPIPLGTTLLSVDGDNQWDRIHMAARIDHPELFAHAKETKQQKNLSI